MSDAVRASAVANLDQHDPLRQREVGLGERPLEARQQQRVQPSDQVADAVAREVGLRVVILLGHWQPGR